MRLKSIDIHGFKSFPDRTKLNFNDGITAVVGPNGSGKSNIADAVRWVLGEQSTRTLRGGKMEDVIFGGTQTRKSQGYASVAITIDNADRSLDMESDEVVITRNLYRSGESEYKINGANVRLKDINELLMDTGLGRDGYSIIGQGRISDIVSAKSTDRREIIEEAAGISKFRYRKTEAERRLVLAQDNLLRLNDILLELDSRIEPLKAQSQKALKYIEFAGEKKDLEVSVWVSTVSNLKTKMSAVEDKLLLTQSDFSETDKTAKELEEEHVAETERGHVFSVQVEEKREELSRLSDSVNNIESQVAILKNDIGHHERAINDTEDAMKQSGSSKDETKALIEEKNLHLEQKQQELLELNKQKETLDNDASSLEKENAKQLLLLDSLRLRRAAVFEEIEAAKLEAVSSSSILGESEQRLSLMDEAIAERNNDIQRSENEYNECVDLDSSLKEQLQSNRNTINGYTIKSKSKETRVEELKSEISGIEQEINSKAQRSKMLLEMERSMEGFGQSVKYVMNASKSGKINGVFGDRKSVV